MATEDVCTILEKLERIETSITELKEHNIRAERKRLECQDVFDERYMQHKDMPEGVRRCYEELVKRSRGTFAHIKDIVLFANIIIVILIGLKVFI